MTIQIEFHLRAIKNNGAMNILIVLSICLVELQNHRAFNCSSSADIAKQFAKMIILIFNNTAMYEYSSCFISLSTLGIISLLHFSHSDVCAVVSHSPFILHFHDG